MRGRIQRLGQVGATMPIYEYECRECDHPFELLVLGATTAACPACEATDVEKLVSLSSSSSDSSRRRNISLARKYGGKDEIEKAHAEHDARHKHSH
ncbi:MAG TPA: zinc ribbon domain-containing protein [Gemmatimonadetes bacterium]|nr:hypothetical protein [Gemmatimonadota bacterium]HIN52597.1 zinc ribbon domain-containing protein [Gemmatimonadota bacterium]